MFKQLTVVYISRAFRTVRVLSLNYKCTFCHKILFTDFLTLSRSLRTLSVFTVSSADNKKELLITQVRLTRNIPRDCSSSASVNLESPVFSGVALQYEFLRTVTVQSCESLVVREEKKTKIIDRNWARIWPKKETRQRGGLTFER